MIITDDNNKVKKHFDFDSLSSLGVVKVVLGWWPYAPSLNITFLEYCTLEPTWQFKVNLFGSALSAAHLCPCLLASKVPWLNCNIL